MNNPRILKMQRGVNFRELGGYTNRTGQTIKHHKLLRSGKLGDLTNHDLEFLNQYGVKFDIDFRSPEEKSASPDRVPLDAKYQFIPVFNVDETQSSQQTKELQQRMRLDATTGLNEMRKVYRDLITSSHAQNAYRNFFDQLLANSDEQSTLLFHCTAGKDRTGMGAIFLLNALNIDENTIKADYLLTNIAAKKFQDDVIKSLQLKNSNAAYIQSMRALQSVHVSYYNTAMAEVKRLSGSIDNYLHDYLKLSSTELKDLQKIYLTN